MDQATGQPTGQDGSDDDEWEDNDNEEATEDSVTLQGDRVQNNNGDLEDEPSGEPMPSSNFFLKDIEPENTIIEPCTTLSHARDQGYLDTSVDSAHQDDAVRAVAALIYWVRHHLSESHCREFITPGRFTTKSPIYELWRHRVLGWQYNFQGAIMKFYRAGVYAIVDDMADFFSTATKNDRMELWDRVFSLAPIQMARASLVGLTGSVPVDEIYSHDGVEHKKWQAYIQTVFKFTADNTYVFRYLTDDASKDECFKRWVSMPHHPAFGGMNLDDLMGTPVKTGGIWDQGRRKKVQTIDYDADEQISVSQLP